ncbi:MAG: efflux RND transporter permease subunit, partial [Planctomycetes bacterium]|nr:efflux RND transporter permease subunit [Planctomycetota bacterium]
SGEVVRGFINKDDDREIVIKTGDGKRRRIPKREEVSRKPVHSDLFMSNYTLINIKDELLRVDGVADVNIMGERDYSIRVWLDPQKLASRNMTANDVATAIRSQNLQAAVGALGSPPSYRAQSLQIPLDTLGRLSDPEQFGNIVVKVGQTQPTPRVNAGRSISPGSESGDVLLVPGEVVPGGVSATTTVGGANVTGGADVGGGATSGGGANAVMIGATTKTRVKRNPTERALLNPALSKGPNPPSVSVVRLKDVARVELDALNYAISCTFDGGPSVGLNVYQLPGTNALDVGDRVRAKMKALRRAFPDGLDYAIAYDTTPFIRESISEVFHTLRDAVILVAIVVLLFLQDWRAMILPMIDVPVSLIGTFAIMALFGYSLNNISLFGLVLAIGIVVDDAIVVLENIERQMAKGLDTRAATIKAMEEITGPILAITLVLCAVFVPCAFISGITGRFFRQFAVTIAASTVISAINALTMTPSRALVVFSRKNGHEHKREALPWWIFGLLGWLTLRHGPKLVAAVFDLPDDGDDDEFAETSAWLSIGIGALYFAPGMIVGLLIGWFVIEPVNFVLGGCFRAFNSVFDRLTDVYGWTIAKALRISAIVIVAYGVLLLLTYVAFRDSPRGFVPQQDMGRVMVSVQLPDSASMDRTKEVVAQVDQIMRETPGVAHTIGLSGISFIESTNGSNFASFYVILKPFAERQEKHLRADAIIARLNREFSAKVLNARVFVSPSSQVPGVSTSGGFKLYVQDRGGLGLGALQAQTELFINQVKQQIGDDIGKKKPADDDAPPGQPMLTKVATQFRSSTPQLYVNIDRVKAASLGVPLEEINQAMQIYLGSFNVNRFNEFGRYWQVTLQADRQFRARMEDINRLHVRNSRGQMVPLGTLVEVKERTGPIFVRRYNLYAAAPITGAIVPGFSSGEVIGEVERISEETLPRSMRTEWTELMFMQIKEGNTTGIVFAFAVACVFLALAALYESWTLPLAVILVVPLSMLCSIVGVLLRKNVFGQDASVDIFVQIGLVVLVGLACKNSILIVEFARELHEDGKSVYDATLEASRLRLRPILMTSFAFILGVVPLCFASGAGAEMRRSLGTAVFSGMLGVTLFGIFLTPVFFHVIQGIGDTPLFSVAAVQWIGSAILGGLLGAGIAYILARLSVFPGIPRFWVVTTGAAMGALLTIAVRGLHKTLTAKPE